MIGWVETKGVEASLTKTFGALECSPEITWAASTPQTRGGRYFVGIQGEGNPAIALLILRAAKISEAQIVLWIFAALVGRRLIDGTSPGRLQLRKFD